MQPTRLPDIFIYPTMSTSSEFDTDHFHRSLAHFNCARTEIGNPDTDWQHALAIETKFRQAEGLYLDEKRCAISALLPSQRMDTTQFLAWFASLEHIGPGQQHYLFDWLAEHATLEEMHWFLKQEAAGEAGFEDLLAYTQIRLPSRAKLECARNFWDEMGHGKLGAMHGEMLKKMVECLDLQPSIDTTVWESLALGNTMLGLAMSRRYAYQSIGALGVIELTAPSRVKKIAAGMRRLGLDARARAYFDLHAALDVSHARAWIAEVIRPLIEADPQCARWIAEGALMRLTSGEQCFNRYAAELLTGYDWEDESPSASAPASIDRTATATA
jgi:pyrroloquinoline quinone (PQQ) biosynthesis protein C